MSSAPNASLKQYLHKKYQDSKLVARSITWVLNIRLLIQIVGVEISVANGIGETLKGIRLEKGARVYRQMAGDDSSGSSQFAQLRAQNIIVPGKQRRRNVKDWRY